MYLDPARTSVQIAETPSVRHRSAVGGPRVCLVDWLESRAPRLADRLPPALVDPGQWSSGTRRDAATVERTTISSPAHVAVLPGLADQGSGLRDAARLALLVGAPAVDVLLVRAPGAQLHSPLEEGIGHLLAQLLDQTPSCALVFPGPGTRWGSAPEDRSATLARFVENMAPGWRARRQVALFDMPGRDGVETWSVPEIASSDAALCRFRGSRAGLRAHGWRSAAAVYAALLVSGAVGTGLAGCRVPLGAGRQCAESWVAALSPRAEERPPPEVRTTLPCAEIGVQNDGTSGLVLSEGSLRAPAGEWPLSTLWSMGRIHDALLEAAERFVFRAATSSEAALLSAALHRAVRPWVERGLLVGPSGSGTPSIATLPERDVRSPALITTLEAMLRPWQRRITLRLALPPDGSPRTELS